MEKSFKYVHIKNEIKQMIEEGRWQPGDVIPPEGELVEMFCASRISVRRAIEELVKEEILEKEFGKTPRVKKADVYKRQEQFVGLSKAQGNKNIKISNYIVRSEKLIPGNEVSEAFKLMHGEKALMIKRIRYADGRPLCLQVLYLNLKVCGDFDARNLVNQSLYDVLEEKGVLVVHSTQEISAVPMPEDAIKLLELPYDTSALLVKFLSYDRNWNCVEYSKNYYVGARYSLTMEMTR